MSPAAGNRRVLFIALDAVSYEVAKQALGSAADGTRIFEGFSPVAALVSSFPSTSTPAFTGLFEPFGVEVAPGYEANFFDRDRNKVRGGATFSYLWIDFGWRDFFDYRRKSIVMRGIRKLTPIRGSLQELQKGLRRFLHSDQSAFFIYSALTDTAGHLRSPESVESIFRDLDRMLRELRREYPAEPFHTVVFSDHGMAGGEPLANVAKSVRRALADAGWKRRSRLKGPRDIVFAPFGLVSSFEVFTLPGRGQDAAEVMAAVPGVDLCVTSEADGWRIHSRRGNAIARKQLLGGVIHWSYEEVGGDPLGYGSFVDDFRRRTGGQPTSFPDSWWFEATRLADYPDALHRISRGFDLVVNPASVICSLEQGYMHGARLTELGAAMSIGDLRWTHGALRKDASLGFLVTDFPSWRPVEAVRFDEALEPFSELLAERPSTTPGVAIASADK